MQRRDVRPALLRKALVEQRAESSRPLAGEVRQVECVGERLGVAQDRPQILVAGQDVEAALRHPKYRIVLAQVPVVGKRVLLDGGIQQKLVVVTGHSSPPAWTSLIVPRRCPVLVVGIKKLGLRRVAAGTRGSPGQTMLIASRTVAA